MLKNTVDHSDSVSWRKGIDPGCISYRVNVVLLSLFRH